MQVASTAVLAAGVALSAGLAATPAIAADADKPGRTVSVASAFWVCSPVCDLGDTYGTITWYNRTANVTGEVTDVGSGSTTALFEAFAGSTKIDTQTRAADDGGSVGSPRPFSFVIGDPDLVGGINRIRITVCWNYTQPNQSCGTPVNYLRP